MVANVFLEGRTLASPGLYTAGSHNPLLAGNMCQRQRGTLPAKTTEMRELLSALSLTKPRQNAQAILNICGLFIYGDTRYITNIFRKNVLKIATP